MKLATAACLIAIGAPTTAHAAARQPSNVLLSEDPSFRAIQEKWGFADAVIAGDTVYLSGVVATLKPGETDLKAPYERAFKAIGRTLERAGSSWDDVVDMISFHTDLTTQVPAMVEVKAKYLRGAPPAWTAIQVARLAPDSGLTEIKIVAKKSAPAR